VTTSAAERQADQGGQGPTVGSVWQGMAGGAISDELLDWPPDLFAFTDVILERAEVFRFVLSPPVGLRWPPDCVSGWGDAIRDAARDWSRWVEERDSPLPQILVDEWAVVRERLWVPL
jgi:hypothetical protein